VLVQKRTVAVVPLACLGFFLSGCMSDDGCDGPGVTNSLASVDRWVQVSDVAAIPDVAGTSSVPMTTATVTESGQGKPVSGEIRIHSDFTGPVDDALADGYDAFLALERVQGKETVSFVVVRTPGGEHTLPGLVCGQEDLLREQLGADYDSVLDSLIGVTSAHQVRAELRAYGLG
jgi:hypothetical protein